MKGPVKHSRADKINFNVRRRQAMDDFGSVQLTLNKSVKKGDAENLLSLFDANDRFKTMEVLTDAEEDTIVKVILEGLGEIDLKLGADMEKGSRKTIMTLFWFVERSKNMAMLRDAEVGEKISLKIMK
jgi:hypothetical protein